MPKLTGYHDRRHEKLTVQHSEGGVDVYDDESRRINYVIEGDAEIYIGLTTPNALRLIAKLAKLVGETV